MNNQNLVIKEQKSNLWYASVATLLILSVVGTFIFGRYLALTDLSQTKQSLNQAQQMLDKTQTELNLAKESLVMQQQSSQVDNLSTQELLHSVKLMQQQQKEPQTELKFYRRILAPELDKDGLAVDSFRLAKTDLQGQFHFRTTLIQAGKQNAYLKGYLILKVSGLQSDVKETGEVDKPAASQKVANKKVTVKEMTYTFKQLGSFKAKFFQFQFKYFQNFQGFIKLPKGFKAKNISIYAKTRGRRKNQSTKKQLIWKPEERQNYARYE